MPRASARGSTSTASPSSLTSRRYSGTRVRSTSARAASRSVFAERLPSITSSSTPRLAAAPRMNATMVPKKGSAASAGFKKATRMADLRLLGSDSEIGAQLLVGEAPLGLRFTTEQRDDDADDDGERHGD